MKNKQCRLHVYVHLLAMQTKDTGSRVKKKSFYFSYKNKLFWRGEAVREILEVKAAEEKGGVNQTEGWG